MERSQVENYLKKLQELDEALSDETNSDALFKEINSVLNSLSTDIQNETTKNTISVTLKFINMSNNPDPEFVHKGDSGFDLRAFLDAEVEIPAGRVLMVPTGLYFEVNKGLEIQVRSRSGLAAKNNIMVLNSPGTVDSFYRGEIKIILANFGTFPFTVKNGDRIAQAVVCPVYGEGNLIIKKVEKLSETIRNSDGFGSSGIQ